MILTIKLYGILQEIAEKEELKMDFESEISASEVLDVIKNKYPAMSLVQMSIAVNQKIAFTQICKTDDEIAILPPFAGG